MEWEQGGVVGGAGPHDSVGSEMTCMGGRAAPQLSWKDDALERLQHRKTWPQKRDRALNLEGNH